MESQDIGNHHFGVVVKAYGFFSETFALKKAGEKQIKSGTSKIEWQIYETQNTYMTYPSGDGYFLQLKYLLPPYGDDPRDQKWIKAGFNYWKEIFKK